MSDRVEDSSQGALGAFNRDCVDAFVEEFSATHGLHERAREVLAGASVHDSQRLTPFPLYFERAKGPYKWDTNGRRLIDYWMGHGALLLGHCFPPVVEAVSTAMARGCHFGGATESVLRWAEQICRMIPSAQRIRFTSSGTEGTLLALRVARAYTGRKWILRFNGHFHGWHDEALAYLVPVGNSGLNEGAASQVALADLDDVESVIDFIADGEVAGVLLEPGGGSSGGLPWSQEQLVALREGTKRHGSLLIFDEVVSGFRYSPGGVQALVGVEPDLTVLGKIVAGGMPGGVLAGGAEVMSVFGTGTRKGEKPIRVPHTGTFNANPIAAAAGFTMLSHVEDGAPQRRAIQAAEQLVEGVNSAAERAGVDVRLYCQGASIIHILIGALAAGVSIGPSMGYIDLYSRHPERYAALRRGLLIEGVDCHPLHGWVSATHDEEAVGSTIAAFERAFERLRDPPPSA